MRFVPWAHESSTCFICVICRCQNINAADDLRAHPLQPSREELRGQQPLFSRRHKVRTDVAPPLKLPLSDMRANRRTTRSMAAALRL